MMDFLHCLCAAELVIIIVAFPLLTSSGVPECDVFLEQPEPVLEPLGTEVQLTCQVNTTFRISWSITPRGETVASSTDSPGDLAFLITNHGFVSEISTAKNREPPLTVNGTMENDQVIVQCIAITVEEPTRKCPGIELVLAFYGPPSAPFNVTVSENGAGSLNISWSLTTIEGVAVEFTLLATNLEDSTEIVIRTAQYHSIITLADNTSCDVYSIQVGARNNAGSSSPSNSINQTFPSLPDISPLEDSLRHSLVKTADGVVLTITFNATLALCPDYPVRNKTLVLETSPKGGRIVYEEISGGGITVVERTLETNSHYSFYVMVVNEVGATGSRPVMIRTSDLQAVTITRISVSSPKYIIQCSYLSGSDATGCVFIIVSRVEGLENITGRVERNSPGVTIRVANVGCYSEVLAYIDITDALFVRTAIITDEGCGFGTTPTTIPTTDTTSESTLSISQPQTFSSVIVVPVVVVVGVMLLVALALVFILSIRIAYKKGYCPRSRSVPEPGHRNEGPLVQDNEPIQCDDEPRYTTFTDSRPSINVKQTDPLLQSSSLEKNENLELDAPPASGTVNTSAEVDDVVLPQYSDLLDNKIDSSKKETPLLLDDKPSEHNDHGQSSSDQESAHHVMKSPKKQKKKSDLPPLKKISPHLRSYYPPVDSGPDHDFTLTS